jgi:hypothetical protein
MTTESAVADILAHPLDHEWTIQGLGMLRTYLDDEHIERLHIWDTDEAVDSVSTIHDHPWDFTSTIVRGQIRNQRFVADNSTSAPWFNRAQIRCGIGGGLISEPEMVRVCSQVVESYGPGQHYSMDAPELHESFPDRGAVTVIRRSFHADRDLATVCWRTGDWVSAEPRPAAAAEILHFVGLALGAPR